MQKNKCLVCGERLHVELPFNNKNIFDTRFGVNTSYRIATCSLCKTGQITPLPSQNELRGLYEKYYNFGGEKRTRYTYIREKFLFSILYRLWLFLDGDIAFHSIKGSGRLLDVGCNEGRGLSFYQRNGFKAEGLELNQQAAEEARKNGFKVHMELIEEVKPRTPFDVVVLSNVIEHAVQPSNMLANAARILKPSGQLWISCPNINSWQRWIFGSYWINWHVPFHIVHFSANSLVKLLQEYGFKIQRVQQISPALWMAQSLIVRLLAKQGKSTKQLRNPFLIGALMLLIRSILFPFLWICNRTGHGDCLIVRAVKR